MAHRSREPHGAAASKKSVSNQRLPSNERFFGPPGGDRSRYRMAAKRLSARSYRFSRLGDEIATVERLRIDLE